MAQESEKTSFLKPRLGFGVVALMLLLAGLVMAYSASAITSISAGAANYSYLVSQGEFAVAGLVLAVIVYRFIPFEFWKGQGAWLAWGVCVVLIVLTAAMGVSHGGATRWIVLGGRELQPSEFAKIGLAIMTCKLINDYDTGLISGKDLFIRMIILIGLPVGAIYVTQSDLGTAIICVVCLAAALYFTDKPIVILVTMVALGVLFVVLNASGDGYRSERMVYLDPWNDGKNGFGAGYQTIHSLFALADGGLFGVGLGNSREKFLYLPANNTDYVFAVVCEELGVFGALFIIALFAALFYFGLKIVQTCSTSFTRALSAGLTTMLVFQAFLNIGCAISLFPMTGKPLPFFSVGGSSMLGTMIILGFVMACSRQAELESPEAEYARRRENLRVTTHVDGDFDNYSAASDRGSRSNDYQRRGGAERSSRSSRNSYSGSSRSSSSRRGRR